MVEIKTIGSSFTIKETAALGAPTYLQGSSTQISGASGLRGFYDVTNKTYGLIDANGQWIIKPDCPLNNISVDGNVYATADLLIAALDGIFFLASSSSGTVFVTGTYDASTGLTNGGASLVNGSGKYGQYYVVTAAGSQNFGGATTYNLKIGDFVVYNKQNEWYQLAGGNAVQFGGIQGSPANQTNLQDGTLQGTLTPTNNPIVTGDSFKTAHQKAQGQIDALKIKFEGAIYIDMATLSTYNVTPSGQRVLVLLNENPSKTFTVSLTPLSSLDVNTAASITVINASRSTTVVAQGMSDGSVVDWEVPFNPNPSAYETIKFIAVKVQTGPSTFHISQKPITYYASDDSSGLMTPSAYKKLESVSKEYFMDNNTDPAVGINTSLVINGNIAKIDWYNSYVVLNNATASRYAEIKDMSLAPTNVLNDLTFTISSYPASHKIYGMVVQTSVKCATVFIKASDGSSMGNTYTPPASGEKVTITYNYGTNKYIINEY